MYANGCAVVDIFENVTIEFENRDEEFFRSTGMEPHLYEAICRMVQTQTVDEILTEKEKMFWLLHIPEFTVREDGGLMWKSLKVPTMQQLENELQPIHYGKNVHMRTNKVLRKALSDRGFVLPKFLGGLETACTL